jgi:iron complex outermembrane receptor protein
MSAKSHGSHSVRFAVAIALGAVTMIASAPSIWAQQASDTAVSNPTPASESNAPLEEVTVTGSRIKRKDLESSSPLITIDSEQLESRSGLNLESYLNQLPNYNPAQTPTTENSDVQPSAVNTVGISTISLRGFGPNRSLVLVDGHRTVPVNALMVTDINSIPAAMIDRVEIITGGASAVYGADAIGGVTNFILKHNYEGASIDVQDGMSQAGDGNELRVSTLMGSKIADGRGNIVMGMEYYDRDESYQKNHDFFSSSFNDPNTAYTNAFFGQEGLSGFFTEGADPSAAAENVTFANRVNSGGSPYAYGGSSVFQTIYFNPSGNQYLSTGPIGTSGYQGQTAGNGYALYNEYNPAELNSGAAGAAGEPGVVQYWKHNDTDASLSSPQTRYSFFANGTFDITDDVQFYTNARFAESLTATRLSAPPSVIYGWDPQVPYNETTDSPILPSAVTPTSTQAQVQAVYNAFIANPTDAGGTNPYANPNFIADGAKGAQHPVPWQFALLLNSRSVFGSGIPVGSALANTIFGGGGPTSLADGGPITCDPQIAASECANAPTSWSMWWIPYNALPARTTVDQSNTWQIETGFKFPLHVGDWTGDLYYSRGQSLDYEGGYGNESLERLDAVIDSPDYGRGQTFQGNANNSDTNFGTSVPTTCTSGFYGSLFGGDNVSASSDCLNAVGSTLQTLTEMEQDIVEANFSGTIMKGWAGDISGALGYQYRRDAGQFTPDNLQATNSFLDEPVGLYPLGTLQQEEISAKDGYAELFIPLASGLPFLKKLNLDIGGRYSDYSNTPNAVTFKVNIDAQLTNSLRVRAGYNRATRAPNLGELYLGEQEYFGGGAQFGDPCSLRSTAPFGAGAAVADMAAPDVGKAAPVIASGQTAAGALSTYLICTAQMGGVGAPGYTDFYITSAQGQGGGGFAWLNEIGNSNLKSETANTWTAGIVFAQLSDNPWLAGFTGSIDWWQVNIQNAIELEDPDNANFQCYGTVQVTTAAEAAAQAATPACQNVGRLAGSGTEAVATLAYTNQANIGTAGVDVELNWIAQLSDLGLKSIPGAITFNSQDTFLDYYRTKNSPGSFDVTTDWKDSFGPDLAGTNGGAYGYRLNLGIGYVLPSVSVQLRWRFLPSVNSVSHAATEAIVENNAKVAAGAPGTLLSYVPDTTIAAPAWNAFDLSATWTINKTFSLRGGINNLMDKDPAITGASTGFPVGTNLNAVCNATAAKEGCQNPVSYSLPNDGAGQTNAGFYDVYGRVFWLGAKAQF